MITCYIGIGSNVQRHRHIEAGCRELATLTDRLRLSSVYECPSVGFDSHAFYNLVAELTTTLSLPVLLEKLRDIERRWGRESNAKKFQDRTLDLDLLLYGEQVSSEAPVLPRRDIYHYPFVIQPLYELSPQLLIPGSEQTVQEVWQATPDLDSLTLIPLWFSISKSVN